MRGHSFFFPLFFLPLPLSVSPFPWSPFNSCYAWPCAGSDPIFPLLKLLSEMGSILENELWARTWRKKVKDKGNLARH